MEEKNNSKKILVALIVIIVLLIALIVVLLVTRKDKDDNIDTPTIKDEIKNKDDDKEKKDIKDTDDKNPTVTYEYYYNEKYDYYMPEKPEKMKFIRKLYVLSDNTFYFISNLTNNTFEYAIGTYTKEGNILKLSNTKTYTDEKKCFYDDGPYEFEFNLDTMHYTNEWTDISFSKVDNNEDITKVLPNYTIACRELAN